MVSSGVILTIFLQTGKIYIDSENILGCEPFNLKKDRRTLPVIILVKRGKCTFVVKARNAQNAGATLMIVADHTVQNINNIIMSDDGTAKGLKIPSMLIGVNHGDLLIAAANKTDATVIVNAPFEHNLA